MKNCSEVHKTLPTHICTVVVLRLDMIAQQWPHLCLERTEEAAEHLVLVNGDDVVVAARAALRLVRTLFALVHDWVVRVLLAHVQLDEEPLLVHIWAEVTLRYLQAVVVLDLDVVLKVVLVLVAVVAERAV